MKLISGINILYRIIKAIKGVNINILTLLILLSTQLLAFGQKPDQQLIPDFVLKGKSASELRIMRNEIFARYGYIFNSQDLSDHFKTKLWYKPTNTNVDDSLSEMDKFNIERILKYEKLAKQGSFQPSVANETNAYFRIYKDPITGDRLETSRNGSYYRHFNFGTMRKVVERTFTGGEKHLTVVYAKTTDPSKPYWETTKYFDDLLFSTNYYEAIEYGCCDAESYGELYNYTSNEPILIFNEIYHKIDIPNSKIEMFLGYCHEHSGHRGTTISTLYLSTLDGVVSSITFIANNQQRKEDLPWYWSPKVELRTENKENVIRDREIRLWSSNFAKDLNEIKGFSIFIEFWSEGTGKKVQFNIPVIKGKFNGSDEKNTEIIVNLE